MKEKVALLMMLQEVFSPWDNPKFYKLTSLKRVRFSMCMPPLGTKIKNITKGVVEETTKKYPFVATDICGKQSLLSLDEVLSGYTIEFSTELTIDYLNSRKKKMVYNGKKCEVIEPFSVYSKTGIPLMSVFVPKEYVFEFKESKGSVVLVNNPKINHFKGDFIVCTILNGEPNLNDRWVVNGEDFPKMYNMKMYPIFKYNTFRSVF